MDCRLINDVVSQWESLVVVGWLIALLSSNGTYLLEKVHGEVLVYDNGTPCGPFSDMPYRLTWRAAIDLEEQRCIY